MDQHTLNLLEYGRLLELLSDMAASEPGAQYCLNLEPDLTPDQVESRWRLINEAKAIGDVDGPPPLADLVGLESVLSRLDLEGVSLRPLDLLGVGAVIRTSRVVKGFMAAHWEIAPGLTRISEGLPVFKDLEETLGRSISPEGEVMDTASVELGRVRRELSGLRGAIQDKMQRLMREDHMQANLQDDIITRRSGRYVIPVKVAAKRSVAGLVHDYSKSGQTAFVEPLEMVEDNNRLNYLRSQEKVEVEKVLQRLSAMVAGIAEVLEDTGDILAELDGIFAMAAMSRKQKALAPFFNPDGGLAVRGARHPLLDARLGNRAVPLDLVMEPDKRVVVVSGINAGGKTVALKTLGLIALMVRTGLHLPVEEGSRVNYFDRIMAAIGDEQDLSSDLSTFSGHIRRLSWVLDEATSQSLVLLDELGTGTDPAEGAALALAVLDHLKTRGAYVLTATHYHLLKAWAHLNEGAQNAAVRTDPDGRPVYGLEYGTPGVSAGLAMAREMGLDPDVVDRALGYMDDGHKRTLDLIQRLEEERALLNRARTEAESLEDELAQALSRYTRQERESRLRYDQAVRDLREKVDRALADAEMRFAELRREYKNRLQESPAAVDRTVREFKETKAELKHVVPPPEKRPALTNVSIGDRVRVASLKSEGVVIKIQKAKGLAQVDLKGMMVQTPLDDLTRADSPAEVQRPVKVTYSQPESLPHEINLLGMTVDEALPEIEKSLDQALVGGVKQFSIIHGIGTGRLRQAVRGYLSQEPRVKEIHGAKPQAGGEGVTLVELGD
jgi:DNA mismatch repair protein MutS2